MRWIRSQENFKRFPLEAALTRLWSRDFVDGDVFGLSIWQYFFSCPLIKKPENFIMSDASNVKRFCRRCKAHGFKAGIHSACPFKCCKCAECEKIAKHNEMARERARKRRANELAGPLLPSSSVDLTIEQVIQLANKNSGTEVAKKKMSTTALKAGMLSTSWSFDPIFC